MPESDAPTLPTSKNYSRVPHLSDVSQVIIIPILQRIPQYLYGLVLIHSHTHRARVTCPSTTRSTCPVSLPSTRPTIAAATAAGSCGTASGRHSPLACTRAAHRPAVNPGATMLKRVPGLPCAKPCMSRTCPAHAAPYGPVW